MSIQKIKPDIRKQIEKIVTYHSDDPLGGTSGYLLSTEQIDQLVNLFATKLREERQRGRKDVLQMIKEEIGLDLLSNKGRRDE